MDRTAMIEAAYAKAYEKYFKHDGEHLNDHPSNNRRIYEMGFEDCLSLLQWKRIETADDLPKESGIYPVIEKEDGSKSYAYYISRKEAWVTEDGADVVNVKAYIPIPIPQFKEGEDERAPKTFAYLQKRLAELEEYNETK